MKNYSVLFNTGEAILLDAMDLAHLLAKLEHFDKKENNILSITILS